MRRSLNASIRSFGQHVWRTPAMTGSSAVRLTNAGDRRSANSSSVSCPGVRYSTGVTKDCGRSFVWFWYSASRAAVSAKSMRPGSVPVSSSP